MMKLTSPLMPMCSISQKSTTKLMILVTKVEQSKNADFSEVEPAFSGACLVV
jgi:hypothetical protein